jgi:hypothetical protein
MDKIHAAILSAITRSVGRLRPFDRIFPMHHFAVYGILIPETGLWKQTPLPDTRSSRPATGGKTRRRREKGGMTMELGMIGLGRMGANMVRRLMAVPKNSVYKSAIEAQASRV